MLKDTVRYMMNDDPFIVDIPTSGGTGLRWTTSYAQAPQCIVVYYLEIENLNF